MVTSFVVVYVVGNKCFGVLGSYVYVFLEYWDRKELVWWGMHVTMEMLPLALLVN